MGLRQKLRSSEVRSSKNQKHTWLIFSIFKEVSLWGWCITNYKISCARVVLGPSIIVVSLWLTWFATRACELSIDFASYLIKTLLSGLPCNLEGLLEASWKFFFGWSKSFAYWQSYGGAKFVDTFEFNDIARPWLALRIIVWFPISDTKIETKLLKIKPFLPFFSLHNICIKSVTLFPSCN